MRDLDRAAVSYQIVLTKCDKVKPEPLSGVAEAAGRRIAAHPAAHPEIVRTSAVRSDGIELLRAELAALARPAAPNP